MKVVPSGPFSHINKYPMAGNEVALIGSLLLMTMTCRPLFFSFIIEFNSNLFAFIH
jgi:hypothetical protein